MSCIKLKQDELMFAFREWLFHYKLIETDDWTGLSSEELEILVDHHFKIFLRELFKNVPQAIKEKVEKE